MLGLENGTPYDQLPVFHFFKDVENQIKEFKAKNKAEKKKIDDGIKLNEDAIERAKKKNESDEEFKEKLNELERRKKIYYDQLADVKSKLKGDPYLYFYGVLMMSFRQ